MCVWPKDVFSMITHVLGVSKFKVWGLFIPTLFIKNIIHRKHYSLKVLGICTIHSKYQRLALFTDKHVLPYHSYFIAIQTP